MNESLLKAAIICLMHQQAAISTRDCQWAQRKRLKSGKIAWLYVLAHHSGHMTLSSDPGPDAYASLQKKKSRLLLRIIESFWSTVLCPHLHP